MCLHASGSGRVERGQIPLENRFDRVDVERRKGERGKGLRSPYRVLLARGRKLALGGQNLVVHVGPRGQSAELIEGE